MSRGKKCLLDDRPCPAPTPPQDRNRQTWAISSSLPTPHWAGKECAALATRPPSKCLFPTWCQQDEGANSAPEHSLSTTIHPKELGPHVCLCVTVSDSNPNHHYCWHFPTVFPSFTYICLKSMKAFLNCLCNVCWRRGLGGRDINKHINQSGGQSSPGGGRRPQQAASPSSPPLCARSHL